MFSNSINKYKQDIAGSTNIMIAVTLIPIIIAIGAAVDGASMLKKRNYLQSIADSAVLAAASSGDQTVLELKESAASIIAISKYPEMEFELTVTDNVVKVVTQEDYENTFMGAFGDRFMGVTATAEAPLRTNPAVNLALVLDTTASMEGSRIVALRNAANNLITNLEDRTEESDNLKISLVPFADYVRVPLIYRNYTWMEVQDDHATTYEVLDEPNSVNCRQEGPTEYRITVCDEYAYEQRSGNSTWIGCMGSRKDGYHKIADFNGRRVQGMAGSSNCNNSYNFMQPLSADKTLLRAAVTALETDGNTYLPAGLVWGWRTLSPEMPFRRDVTSEPLSTRNIMLLMTDGSNTIQLNGEKPDYNGLYHWEQSRDVEEEVRAASNILTKELCDSIKADGIEIFSVAFEVEDSSTQTLLKDCASGASNYYDANNSAQLNDAFEDIGDSLNEIRLMR